MRRVKLLFAMIIIIIGFGCATPRMGFPAQSLKTPVPVTLFSNIARKGILNKKVDYIGREAWRLLYDQRYLEMISKINVDKFHAQMDDLFKKQAFSIKDLFSIEKKEVFHGALEYSKNEDDPENYSGYDFSKYINDIPTKFLLALTVDEWGYVVTNDKQTTGPYMVFTIQLIDKDTSLSLWRFSNRYQKPMELPLGATEPGDITQADIEDTLHKIIPKALNDIFTWLGQK